MTCDAIKTTLCLYLSNFSDFVLLSLGKRTAYFHGISPDLGWFLYGNNLIYMSQSIGILLLYQLFCTFLP